MQKWGRSLPQPIDFVARHVHHGVAMMRVDERAVVRGVCIFLLGAPALAVGACSTGDQVCIEDSIDRDKSDDCPYGPVGGPKVKVADDNSCQDLPDFAAKPVAGACPSWADVWVRFTAGDGGRCSNAGCHSGASLGAGLSLPADQPGKAYETLSNYQRDGRPYLQDKGKPGAEKAWILCNVQALIGGYSPMPQPGGLVGPTKTTDIALVRDWVNCGMQIEGGGSGGGGVGGGAGGLGGAGGVGGAI